MDFNTYQKQASSTAIYDSQYKIMYPAMGLGAEVGEVLNKVKKIYRDYGGKIPASMQTDIESEIGDVLWYLAALCSDLDTSMEYIAVGNLDKLLDRKCRGVLGGSGDNR
jgi:NTP pyrophosphatase (non-canonical NTP hydrolase)